MVHDGGTPIFMYHGYAELESCETVEFSGWCIMSKAQNHWRDIGRLQVAVRPNCYLF